MAGCRRLLFFELGSYYKTVTDSQILDHLRLLEESGWETQLCIQGMGMTAYRSTLKAIGDVTWMPGRGITVIAGLRNFIPFSLFLNSLVLRKNADRLNISSQDVIHARNEYSAFAAYKAFGRQLPVVFDYRGDGLSEFHYKLDGGGKWYGPLIKMLKKISYQRIMRGIAGHKGQVIAVSRQLAGRLCSYGFTEDSINVISCVADTNKFYYSPEIRDRVRRKLGIQDRYVLVYAGSLVGYQQAGEMVSLFRELNRLDKKMFFLMVTPYPKEAVPQFKAVDQNDFTIVSASHHEVNDFLNAADIGLLIRAPHPLNEVASPTKFAEYALTGLFTVCTRNIGDTEAWISNYGLGTVIEYARLEDEQVLHKILNVFYNGLDQRARRAESGKRYFSRNGVLAKYHDLYQVAMGS
jgi:hypothetical protein